MNTSAKETLQMLTERLNRYRNEYYNLNAPTVSDEVYDRLFDELVDREERTGCVMSNSPTQTVGYVVADGLEKTRHDIPLLSLQKTKSVDEVTRFAKGQPLLVMQKLDGLTVKLEYENGILIRASTRGNGNEGEIITHNMSAVAGVPAQIPYRNRLVVVGEAYILNSDFARLKETLLDSSGKPYKNARNLAAGSIRCLDAETCAKRCVRFTPFGVLEGLDEVRNLSDNKYAKIHHIHYYFGFSFCDLFLMERYTTDDLESALIELREMADDKGIPIDGIVVTYADISFSREQGRTGHHFKDGIAYKFEDELCESVLNGIVWTPTRTGEISPVALFDTVELDGCDVSRASLHNLTFIKELELHIGCRILVSKRNMIIPHIEDNLDRGAYESEMVPVYCPCCGSPTRIHESRQDKNKITETLYCDNPDCAMQRLRQFVHFVSKKAMDIEGLSEATLEKFIGRGWLSTFMDIYGLDRHEWEICNDMDGFGKKSWLRLWDAIQRSRDTTFERYLISMDIPMVGRTASRELSRQFAGSLDAFESAVDSGYDFTQLTDFGEVLHRNIHDWFRIEENRNLWEELQKMMNIENKGNTIPEAANNPFSGLTIVVTGKLELFTRNSINAKIEELGARAGSAVSKNTDYLICGENAGSKLDKARQFGVTILSEQQFLEMAEQIA